jgi:hypothetical protein
MHRRGVIPQTGGEQIDPDDDPLGRGAVPPPALDANAVPRKRLRLDAAERRFLEGKGSQVR